MSGTAIKVDGVHKDFALPHENTHSLKSAFVGLLKGKKGRVIERQHALRNINFTVKQGEFFGIVGRNGSGKSTLLKIIAQIYQPTKGSATINGRLVPFIELGVGFNPELSGRENVYLSAALMGFSKKEIDAMYDDVVEFAELEKFMDQKLKNYSSGMQVRLAFSIATRAQGDILLIDEVLAVGDADFQRKCFRYFSQLKKEGRTVVFVTHDMNAVREYCDRAVFIEKSELVAEGKPAEISSMYERLLSPQSDVETSTGAADRWGDGTLRITSAKLVEVNEKHITIDVTTVAKKDCDRPVLGFVIKNAAGVRLAGTNTVLLKQKIPDLSKNSKVASRWVFNNVFADGSYTVTFAAQYDGGATNGDWWEDAKSFKVVRPRHDPYPISLDVKVDINSVN